MCEEKTKVCFKCGRELPLDADHFYKSNSSKSGFAGACKECKGQPFGQRKKVTGDGWRICPHCERKLPATKEYFSGNKGNKDGLDAICKECIGRVFKKPPPKFKEGYKICSKCGRELPATREYYHKDSNAKTGCISRCLECSGLSFGFSMFTTHIRNGNGDKQCCRCKEWKSEDNFYKSHVTPDGLIGHCKECTKIENANRDPAKGREYNNRPEVKKRREERSQRPDVRERDRESSLKYSKSDKGKAAAKRYRESEKGKANKRRYAEYYWRSPQGKESAEKYRKSEKGKIKTERYEKSDKGIAAVKRYHASDKFRERMKITAHNRRAKMRELECSLTIEQWEFCKEYFNDKCCYCGKKKKLEQDHYIALNKNGEYEKQNIVPACKSCNASKLDHDALEWFRKQLFYSEKREKRILKYLGYVNEKIQQRTLF